MKWKPLNCPLVAGYSIGHKSSPLHVSRWDCRKTHQVYVNSFFCWQRFLFFKVVLMTLIFVKVFIFMASLISHLMLDASPSESISQTLGLGIHVEIFCHTSPSRILLQIKYRPPISKGYPRWQWPSQQDNSEGSATLQELLRCGPKILTSSSRCWPCFQIPQTLIWLTINGTSWNSSDERTSNCGL